jgi:hypothetical protein
MATNTMLSPTDGAFLHTVATADDPQFVQRHLDANTFSHAVGFEALCVAATRGKCDIVRVLLDAGVRMVTIDELHTLLRRSSRASRASAWMPIYHLLYGKAWAPHPDTLPC